MKVLFDVNVILDVLLNRQPWATDSRAAWNANVKGRIEGYVVATAVTNLFYVARKSVGHPLALPGVCDCLGAFDVLSVDALILNEAAKIAWHRLRGQCLD